MRSIPDLDDVGQAGAACLEYGLAIRQRLSCLILDRVSGEAAGARVDADDARDEHVRSGFGSLAVERRTRRVHGRDDLAWQDGSPCFCPHQCASAGSQVSLPGELMCSAQRGLDCRSLAVSRLSGPALPSADQVATA